MTTTDTGFDFSMIEIDSPSAPVAPMPRPVPAPAPVVVQPAPTPAANPNAFADAIARGRAARAFRAANPNREARPEGAPPADLDVAGPSLPELRAARTLTPAERLRSEAHDARANRQAAAISYTTGEVLKAGELVAGGAAEGEGIMTGWTGRGELRRADMAEILAEAELPAGWIAAAKSAHAQAGHSVGILNGCGYVVRAVRGLKRDRQTGARHWAARWQVGTASTAQVGDAYGRTVMTVTLLANNELTIDALEGYSDIANRVRDEFARRVQAETYAAGEVTSWLATIMIVRFRAARLGGSYYVPRAHRADAERLLTSVASRWGIDWLMPALPVATSTQLRAGLASSFIVEARGIMGELETARQEARKERKADITERAAAGFLGRLRSLTERAAGYATLLGDGSVAPVRDALRTALAEVSELAGDTAARGAAIWDELTR